MFQIQPRKQSIAKGQETDKIVLHSLLNSLDFYPVILTRYSIAYLITLKLLAYAFKQRVSGTSRDLTRKSTFDQQCIQLPAPDHFSGLRASVPSLHPEPLLAQEK
jgi:hypothetical protein